MTTPPATLEPTLDEQIAYFRQRTVPMRGGPMDFAILASLERLKALERVAANVLLDEPHEVHDISPARVSRRAWKELQEAVWSKP